MNWIPDDCKHQEYWDWFLQDVDLRPPPCWWSCKDKDCPHKQD